MILAKFRERYPQGSLVSKLVHIDRGNFIVRVSIKVENITLVTALAGASSVEVAEDTARTRAIAALCLDRPTSFPDSASQFAKQITSVEPKQAQAESTVVPKQQDSPVSKKVTRSEKFETSSSSHNTAQPVISDEPEIAPPPSNQGNSNLFEDTFNPPITSSTSGNQIQIPNNTPNEIAEETNTVSLEFADQPSSNLIANDLKENVVGSSANFDFTQVKQKTDIEIARLGWTRDDGREFLQSRYGKRSRLHLKDEELLEFLHYLEKLPTPVN